MSDLQKALKIAKEAHEGQTDKAGSPYIEHVLRVVDSVQGDERKIAAALHDVIEDTHITVEYLKSEGFSESVINAVLALTKNKGESRISAAKRAIKNQIALDVKIADNKDNMNLSRIKNPSKKDFKRQKEYNIVRKILLYKKGLL